MGSCSSLWPHRICTTFQTSPLTLTNGSGTGKAGATIPIGSPKINADGREEHESEGSEFGLEKR